MWSTLDVGGCGVYDACICSDHTLLCCGVDISGNRVLLTSLFPHSTDVDIFGLNRQQSEMRDGLCLLLC